MLFAFNLKDVRLRFNQSSFICLFSTVSLLHRMFYFNYFNVSESANRMGTSLSHLRQLVVLLVLSLTFFIKHVKDPINALNLNFLLCCIPRKEPINILTMFILFLLLYNIVNRSSG